jgi:hypothetical protein
MSFLKARLTAIFLALIIGMVFIPIHPSADSNLLPKIPQGDSPPIIDGNITAEWESSFVFDTTVNSDPASVRVTTDNASLYIGFNYTTSFYVPVNDTLPVNATEDYNPSSHNWMALQIDNNLDQAEKGTKSSPDDVLVIDQYRSEISDGFMNNSDDFLIINDVNNSGSNDGAGSMMNTTIDENPYLAYEYSKALSSSDTDGFDFNLEKANILQFRILVWLNSSANATVEESYQTEWFTLRVNTNGTGVALKHPTNTTVSLSLDNVQQSQFNAIPTVLEQHGINTITGADSNVSSSGPDLWILVLGAENALSDEEIDILAGFISLGGKLILMLSEADSAGSEAILSRFGMAFLPNKVLQTSEGSSNDTSTVVLPTSAINQDMPFMTGPSLFVDTEVEEISLATSALNISNVSGDNPDPYILGQEYAIYDLFDLPENIAYDSDNDGDITSSDSKTGVSLGVSIDLLKGGRVTILASNSLVSDEFLTEVDNIPFFLRLLPWNSKLTNSLMVDSVSIDRLGVTKGETVTITVEVIDGFGNALTGLDDTLLTIEVIITGSVAIRHEVTGINGVFIQEVKISSHGWFNIETTVFLDGYGFAEGETMALFSQNTISPYNRLEDIDPILFLIFAASIGIIVIIWLRVNKKD